MQGRYLAEVLSRIRHVGPPKCPSRIDKNDILCEKAFRVGESAMDDPGDSQRTVSRRQEQCFMLKRAFRAGESALGDLGEGQRTVSRRRERGFMLK